MLQIKFYEKKIKIKPKATKKNDEKKLIIKRIEKKKEIH